MLIRFLAIVIAFGLLGFAVFRVAKHDIQPSPSNAPKLNHDLPNHSVRWLSRTKVLVTENQFPEETKPLKWGDIFSLIQTVDSGHRCLLAVFRVSQLREKVVALDAIGRVPNSRLKVWADALNLTTSWSWLPVHGDKTQQSYVQRCQTWIKLPDAEHVVRQKVRGRRFFIKGSQYSEIQSYDKQQIRLEVDYFRHGWWVHARKMNGSTELKARNSETGQLEKLILHFAVDSVHQPKKVSNHRAREPMKSFALPGWE